MSGGSPSDAPILSPFELCRLLIGLRLKLLRNRLRGGPHVGTARLAAFVALLVPLAYLGLFATAFEVIGQHGGVAAQGGAVTLVVTAIVLSSGALKIAGRQAIFGAGGGDGAFLLLQPVSLPSLVLARGMAGVVTDLYGAFFLLPILAAAALAFGQGAPAILLAAAISLLVQVAVTALCAAAQLLIERLVSPARRRVVWMGAALLAALAMAGLWMAGSAVLRTPTATAASLIDHESWLRWLPGAWIVSPVSALREGDVPRAAAAFLGLAAGSAAALVLAWGVARVCVRRGWEVIDGPFPGGAPAPSARAGRSTLFRKDWRLLRRDHGRLVTFLAMPALFVGMQAFGSAGWDWLSGETTHLALLAYSLAAYAAIFGPLQHMGAEGRAFWILHTAPVPIGRLLAEKAAFQTCLVAVLAAGVYAGLLLLARPPLGWSSLGLGLLVVAGAAVISWLAVGLATAVADLSDDGRPGVGIGTTYLFMLVAGLFNVAILQPGPDRFRALALYVVAAGTAWIAGVERARIAYDAELVRRPALSATVGALGAVALFLGERAAAGVAATLDPDPAAWAQLPWVVLVGAAAFAHRRRARPRAAGGVPPPAALAIAVAAGALSALAAHLLAPASPAGLPLGFRLVRALSEELIVRGVFQAGLARPDDPVRRRVAAAAASTLVAWAVSPSPWTAAGGLAAIAPAAASTATGRLWPALITRALLELLPGGH